MMAIVAEGLRILKAGTSEHQGIAGHGGQYNPHLAYLKAETTADFIVPPNVTTPDKSVSTYTGLRGVLDSIPPNFKVTKASKAEFPALDGHSVSMAVLQFPASGVNPPHTHPRAAELLFVVEGSLEVGFVDTTNKLFTQTLQTVDIFVFPKGLVHYQYNVDPKEPSTVVSAFGSASAALLHFPQLSLPLDDFIVPPNVTTPDGIVFTYTSLCGVLDSIPPNFEVTKASKAEFPALDGHSVSIAVLQFPAGGVDPPHTRPRAAEL
ncbi:unnamed protein product [Fraxinus pennsylvanica]|uniref:Germin-like protein n=1 Tax=Fraxinus pennsylvanica TaxID=56036 RepID=A0AAD2E9P0_9LAMI|nr:unnamed protein product [Fraxinus pennsylvanica]